MEHPCKFTQFSDMLWKEKWGMLVNTWVHLQWRRVFACKKQTGTQSVPTATPGYLRESWYPKERPYNCSLLAECPNNITQREIIYYNTTFFGPTFPFRDTTLAHMSRCDVRSTHWLYPYTKRQQHMSRVLEDTGWPLNTWICAGEHEHGESCQFSSSGIVWPSLIRETLKKGIPKK